MGTYHALMLQSSSGSDLTFSTPEATARSLFLLTATIIISTSSSALAASASFNVVALGAKGDGRTDSTRAFQRAWSSACASSGASSNIYVPPGRYLLNRILFRGQCKGHVTFKIDGTLVASSNYHVLASIGKWITFAGVRGVSIYGGTIDGQGTGLWACKAAGKNCPFGATVIDLINGKCYNDTPKSYGVFFNCTPLQIDFLLLCKSVMEGPTPPVPFSRHEDRLAPPLPPPLSMCRKDDTSSTRSCLPGSAKVVLPLKLMALLLLLRIITFLGLLVNGLRLTKFKACPFQGASLMAKALVFGLVRLPERTVLLEPGQIFHIVIHDCKNVKLQQVQVTASGNSPNTDGIHVQGSTDVTITQANIKTGDDCISIGPGTTNLWMENTNCGPGHGIRKARPRFIGSLSDTTAGPKLRCLLSVEGININAINKSGESALDMAEKSENSDAASVLKEAGAVMAKDQANPPNPAKQLKQTVSDIKHDVQSQLQQTRQTRVRVQKIAKRLKKLHISGLNNAINSATVVAVLIATVAFAAIFTVPGQYVETRIEGMTLGQAYIANNAAFVIFIVFDSVALFISLAVVVVQTSVVVIEQQAKKKLMFVINKLMWLACLFISVAFIALTYIVVGHHALWLAIYATVIGGLIMLTTLGSMCYCVILHRMEESNLRNIRRASESRSHSFSVSMVSETELLNSEYKRMYAV
ncbi:hypothetical protein Scep_029267 [Stephania cephalantha]|uniref:PGG domain-containing protein n=1 Tax=Stephania cephalantha TaxID=152367 RepID=A0AAP0DXD7_9MAGN